MSAAAKRTQRLLRELAVEQQNLCAICREPFRRTADRNWRKSIDHIVPVTKGGTRARSNLQLTHRVCNLRKGNDLPGAYQHPKLAHLNTDQNAQEPTR